MNILNLLTKEKDIAGIEINDKVIRVAYFRPKKRFLSKINPKETDLPENELVLIEEPIAPNIIQEGVVLNKEILGKKLKNIWTKAKLSSNYAIVSIPEDKVYSRIFPFPKTVNDSQLVDAINLTIDFQLPVKKDDVYVGWENAGDSHVINEVLISTIPKTVANSYIEALNYAGIKVLALETHIASIARSAKIKLGQATLFTKKNADGATVFILKDGVLRFSRTIPATFIKNDEYLINEAKYIKTSFESEKKISVIESPLSETTIRDEYTKYPGLKDTAPEIQSKLLVVMGATIRGKIPKGQDNRISLLSIGTVKAYEYQKTTTFIRLVRNMTIGVSLFFLFSFLASYLFIFFLSQATNITANIPTPSIPPDMIQKETWVKNVDSIISASQTIISNTPTWSILLDDINSHIITGILISNLSVVSINDTMSISGTAKDRDTLNQFKKTLQESTYLTAVELPITNLQQKGDIPFSISFRLKDPSMLYNK